MEQATQTPGRFVLNVPDSWAELDVTGEALAETRAAAMAAARNFREQAEINDLFRQAREISRAARRRGALFAAGTATMFDDGLFLGYTMVFAISVPPGRELTLPVLAAQLSPAPASGPGTAPRSGNGGEPSDRKVTTVTLPEIGQVARITGTEETPLTAEDSVRMLTMHTVVPVPGTERDYLIITCASPNLPLRAEVYELFDAISGTFRFLPAAAPAGA
ncbi:hypothetical protein Sme01_68490 [Sphaerisporangium melleum]|uniref:Uncharacterized protein n=1 Tax=Sphaerisporangium melleum TaxID=321316 RepID=A0A917VTA1_9ACTN|nr:hypothetical protein [Sphaerisporangium melleum]GGL12024.1 hypothetical protein GCM10007964_62520 [Sphaerisporangium melleum]GII74373.1 hypothetical protein Sme01_68490 [Sphaerisporangium melleum]